MASLDSVIFELFLIVMEGLACLWAAYKMGVFNGDKP